MTFSRPYLQNDINQMSVLGNYIIMNGLYHPGSLSRQPASGHL